MSDIIPPLPVGQVDTTGVFAADLGKTYNVGSNWYRVLKATAAISGGTQGMQLALALTAAAGNPTWGVALNGTRANYYVCGAIPSTLTGGVVASGLFLGLVQGYDSLAQTTTAASSIASGSILVAGTASDLVRATTAIAVVGDIDEKVNGFAGISTITNTATAIVAAGTWYRAPFR